MFLKCSEMIVRVGQFIHLPLYGDRRRHGTGAGETGGQRPGKRPLFVPAGVSHQRLPAAELMHQCTRVNLAGFSVGTSADGSIEQFTASSALVFDASQDWTTDRHSERVFRRASGENHPL